MRYTGSLAKLRTRHELNKQRNFRGRIIGVEGEEIIFDDKASGIVRVPFAEIKTTKLEIDIEEEFKRAKLTDTDSGK